MLHATIQYTKNEGKSSVLSVLLLDPYIQNSLYFQTRQSEKDKRWGGGHSSTFITYDTFYVSSVCTEKIRTKAFYFYIFFFILKDTRLFRISHLAIFLRVLMNITTEYLRILCRKSKDRKQRPYIDKAFTKQISREKFACDSTVGTKSVTDEGYRPADYVPQTGIQLQP
jgi:hypothetical protein